MNINTFNDDAIAGTAYQVLRTDTSAVAARGTTGTHSGTKLVT